MATTKTTKATKTTKITKTPAVKTSATKTPAAKTAKAAPAKTTKKVAFIVGASGSAKHTNLNDLKVPGTRGRKVGTIGFKWVKAPKEPWPSALECNIMDACEAVEQGTSGDVITYALKHGLGDLTRQIPNKVVTHVMVKLRKAGIISGNDALKAEKKAKTAVVAEPVAKKTKKAKKSRIVMEAATPAAEPVQDASANA